MSKFTDRIDMRFQYIPAAATDVSKTIRREQKRLAEEAAKRKAETEATTIEQELKVRMLHK